MIIYNCPTKIVPDFFTQGGKERGNHRQKRDAGLPEKHIKKKGEET